MVFVAWYKTPMLLMPVCCLAVLLPLIFSAGNIYKFSVFLYILPQNRWRSPSNQAEREEDDKQKILNSNLIYLISSV
jgi:hypothetical protein